MKASRPRPASAARNAARRWRTAARDASRVSMETAAATKEEGRDYEAM